jgi:cytochrome c oxidase subunit 2
MPALNMLLEVVRVAQSPGWMPPNAALHGVVLDNLMRWNLIALSVCFLAAHGWLIAAILRRRKFDQGAKQLQTAFRWATLTALCAMYIWMAITAQRLWAENRFAGPALEAMQVEVVGEQFQWYFRYPGKDAAFGATRPELVNAAGGNPIGLDTRDARGKDDIVSSILILPAGREVDIRLRSLDVIHGFFVPEMRLKQNAVPGLLLHVHFTPTVVGTYPILCSQVCGSGHARMQAVLSVLPPADFQTWLTTHEHSRAQENAP